MKTMATVRSLVLVSLVLVAAACGGGDDGADVPADAAAAESCAELADVAIASAQVVLDEAGTASVDDTVPAGAEAANADLQRTMDEVFARSDLPDCDAVTLGRLICERNSSLESAGELGDGVVAFFYAPPCDQYAGGIDEASASAGRVYLDEPLPALQQFEDATTCDEMHTLLAGVENERFRLKTDVTLAEDLANNLGDWDFQEYYDAFSDRQGDLGCSDQVFMEVLENSNDALCERWIAEGHHAYEEPLMLNTAQCLGL